MAGFSRLAILWIIYGFIMTLIGIYTFIIPLMQPPSTYQINQETHNILHDLIKTKYFRLIRINLNRQCQLYAQNRICKSNSCTVCRCDEKDIPMNWMKTDRVDEERNLNVDIWQKQRNEIKGFSWIWHVQDEQNDEGEYFDLDKNIESFTHYNGSTVWKMIYEDNCFQKSKIGRDEDTCEEERVFFKVMSGLHSSISSHLTRFYKNISSAAQLFADPKDSEELFVNHEQYKKRILDHPERVKNLLFLYQVFLKAIKEISPYMLHNYTVNSENIVEDLKATQLLHDISKKFQRYSFEPFDQQLKRFFYPENPKVQLYQKYIHNISKLMNCVECEKCRLFGKMQTYGIGTALKILLGYNDFYKRNEVVALFNAWNKISMSVNFYFEEIKYQEIFWFRLVGVVGGSLLSFLSLLSMINIRQKIKKMFKHVKFPSSGVYQKYKD